TWSISAGWSAISASRRGPALRPKPASNRTLVIRRRQVEAYPNWIVIFRRRLHQLIGRNGCCAASS
ncbi:hypothetical protein U9455_24815, partial [Escherichia coli]